MHEAYAHVDITIVCVWRGDLRETLSRHTELYEGMLRLYARHIRQWFGMVEDLSTLPLRARLDAREVRIGLQLGSKISLASGNRADSSSVDPFDARRPLC
jgi:CRP-like cAMP-binding protein